HRHSVVVAGMAFGALPDLAQREAARLRLVALVHLPLAAEVGIDAETASRLEAAERRALASAARVVVTGRATADVVASYGVASHRIAIVEPGTETAPPARGSGDPSTVH